MEYELIATSTFGLEAVVRREVEDLGYKVTKVSDGKVAFLGDERAIVRANLWLRTADRVLIKMAEFRAEESEELFQQVRAIEWSGLIPEDGKFVVNCSTVRSKLRSEPNNQKTVKKAIVESLRAAYGIPEGEMLPETGASYTAKVSLLKDVVTITVDTSGEALHKRGYRVAPIAAPIKETMAAALVELSFWKAGRVLIDPCCGSGTIPVEAAMIGRGVAPGFCAGTVRDPVRRFASEGWDVIPHEIWDEERKNCLEAREPAGDEPLDVTACDVDPRAVKAAKENAEKAGVAGDIRFMQGDIGDILEKAALANGSKEAKPQGIIITNPPYGERIGDEEQKDRVFSVISGFMKRHPDWSVFLISPDKKTEEKTAGRRADRRRKLYNGNIQVNYYQFHGTKPGTDINALNRGSKVLY